MNIPLMLNISVDNFLNVIDFYGYAKGDTEIIQIAVLQVVTHIINSSKKFKALPLQEDRVHLESKPGNIGVSFSLIFKNQESLYRFLDSHQF